MPLLGLILEASGPDWLQFARSSNALAIWDNGDASTRLDPLPLPRPLGKLRGECVGGGGVNVGPSPTCTGGGNPYMLKEAAQPKSGVGGMLGNCGKVGVRGTDDPPPEEGSAVAAASVGLGVTKAGPTAVALAKFAADTCAAACSGLGIMDGLAVAAAGMGLGVTSTGAEPCSGLAVANNCGPPNAAAAFTIGDTMAWLVGGGNDSDLPPVFSRRNSKNVFTTSIAIW